MGTEIRTICQGRQRTERGGTEEGRDKHKEEGQGGYQNEGRGNYQAGTSLHPLSLNTGNASDILTYNYNHICQN